MAFDKAKRRARIQKIIRTRVSGTSERPRLSVFRSNKGIYAQIIDDTIGKTLVSVSSKHVSVGDEATKVASATAVGKELASRAQEKGISKVVFDRSGYLYHGRVKSLAEGAREGGLNF
ncbi:50S ribosomal protein L18 [Hymenobacter sp. BT175]|uniref:50S ribosomal protein L18 n=1 Tax=Hymenobacter translucens TaxID=2886507 RepID=UPI001D0DF6AF|nr:50S ribosomal protein L18 [Hymenobacter translucens]MCC2548335.1 50S ribosomal protein L18 [Hymenobacter translucens]